MYLYGTNMFFCVFPAKQIVHIFYSYEVAYGKKKYANI